MLGKLETKSHWTFPVSPVPFASRLCNAKTWYFILVTCAREIQHISRYDQFFFPLASRKDSLNFAGQAGAMIRIVDSQQVLSPVNLRFLERHWNAEQLRSCRWIRINNVSASSLQRYSPCALPRVAFPVIWSRLLRTSEPCESLNYIAICFSN